MTTSKPLSTEPKLCQWQRDEEGNDSAGCGGIWCLEDGTPAEHGMKFCPFCGGTLEWHDFVEPVYCEDCDTYDGHQPNCGREPTYDNQEI